MKTKNINIMAFSGAWCSVLITIGVMVLANTVSADNPRLNREFNEPGNILIADQFNNRVIEVDKSGNIVWSFGRGPNDFSARSVIGVNECPACWRFHADGRHWNASRGDSSSTRRCGGQPRHAGGFLRQNRLAIRAVWPDWFGAKLAGYTGAMHIPAKFRCAHHRPSQQPHYRGKLGEENCLAISKFEHKRVGPAQWSELRRVA